MRILAATILVMILGGQASMAEDFQFDSIDGGTLSMSDWQGRPVLVVNTASQCGFTYQYEALQQLHETYRDQGLIVLAVPSDDFNQELSDEAAVKDFCTLNFGLDVPMTTITKVRGDAAHPFFIWLKQTADYRPRWNFYKVLLDGDGAVVDTFASTTGPMSRKITKQIETLLN